MRPQVIKDSEIKEILQAVKPYTMTSPERIVSLVDAVQHVIRHDIPGDIVECGVWKGGSMMAVAKTLQHFGAQRNLHLYDTFDGMTEPEAVDADWMGQKAKALMDISEKDNSEIWGYCPLEEVRRNLESTGYDGKLISYIKGAVESTIPDAIPETISLLRLDTDWYASTLHELEHLYPRLSVGGLLIIDDYGHWQGARKAVDEYLERTQTKLFLSRIDYTARIGVKTA